MSEKLLDKIDFRKIVPYDPNSEPIECSILIKKAERAEVPSIRRCLYPRLPCFECPLAQRVRNFAELDFTIARTPYGLDELQRHHGSGENRLRTESGAQTMALRVGDVFATGERLISNPRVGANGSVWLHLNGCFVDVPARIPIALQAPFALPADLKRGDIILDGDEVLSDPKKGENRAVWLLLTGGFQGHLIDVPGSIPIALSTKN